LSEGSEKDSRKSRRIRIAGSVAPYVSTVGEKSSTLAESCLFGVRERAPVWAPDGTTEGSLRGKRDQCGKRKGCSVSRREYKAAEVGSHQTAETTGGKRGKFAWFVVVSRGTQSEEERNKEGRE